MKLIFISIYKCPSESIYCGRNGKIFNFLKFSLQESVVVVPFTIMIILFCSLKTVLLHEEFHPRIIPQFMTEWKYV